MNYKVGDRLMCKKSDDWFFRSGEYYIVYNLHSGIRDWLVTPDMVEFQNINIKNNSYLFVGQVPDFFYTIKEYRKKKSERLNALWI